MNSYRSSAAVMLYYLLLMTYNFSSSSCVIISLRRLQIEVGGIVMGMVQKVVVGPEKIQKFETNKKANQGATNQPKFT